MPRELPSTAIGWAILQPELPSCVSKQGQHQGELRCSDSSGSYREVPTGCNVSMQQMGYHEGYRYAHDEPNGYVAGQSYFPEGVARPGWYQPTDRGVERRLGEWLTWLRSLDKGTLPEADA
ncbi:hypothetical protein [Vibrio fluvialis]|uniref:AAA family ATPase n=1 Tax=Vibrio fluvialis TaxID=676 RepID=UPI00301D5A63